MQRVSPAPYSREGDGPGAMSFHTTRKRESVRRTILDSTSGVELVLKLQSLLGIIGCVANAEGWRKNVTFWIPDDSSTVSIPSNPGVGLGRRMMMRRRTTTTTRTKKKILESARARLGSKAKARHAPECA